MKYLLVIIAFISVGCGESVEHRNVSEYPTEHKSHPVETIYTPSLSYSNQRFRNVTVISIGRDSFEIKGQAQIFEASFGWVIEDGHNELQTGFATADAGAPEWGRFSFTIRAAKAETNSTLHLILFETSAEDGSRQHELSLKLY